MVLLNSTMVPLGSPAHDFSLPCTDGKTYSLESFKDKKVLVVIVMCNHCPYVKAVFDRIVAIQKDYAERGLQVIGINPNDEKNYPEVETAEGEWQKNAKRPRIVMLSAHEPEKYHNRIIHKKYDRH